MMVAPELELLAVTTVMIIALTVACLPVNIKIRVGQRIRT